MKIPGEKYPASVLGYKGVCKLDGDATKATLYYSRYTKLGWMLRSWPEKA